MPSSVQTSVLISDAARHALLGLAADWKTSRDEAVRRLLRFYIDHQSHLPGDRQHTNISTVLHYPADTGFPGDPPANMRLPFRAPKVICDRAAGFAYRIPGHASRQAHHDYATRPLSDALVTAIALRQPYVDNGLEDLPQLLERSTADRFWRLVVAASLTRSEREARSRSEQMQYLLTEGGIAWHSPWRAKLALHLARTLFTGPRTAINLQMITEQRDDFNQRLAEVEDPDLDYGDYDKQDLRSGSPQRRHNEEGRAATAVWRVERSIALDALAECFIDGGPQGFVLDPPGWVLTLPPGWQRVTFRRGDPVPSRVERWLADGRILKIDWGSRSSLWPLVGARRIPVDGLEHFVAGARQLKLSPVQIAEALLVATDVDEDELRNGVEYPRRPQLSAEIAHLAGLVDQTERDALLADADRKTRARISETLATAVRHHQLPPGDLQELRDAAGDPPRFARLAKRHHVRFRVSPANWTWDIGSVPVVLADHALRPEQLRLLGREWCRQVTLALERDMQNAWHRAPWWAWAHNDV